MFKSNPVPSLPTRQKTFRPETRWNYNLGGCFGFSFLPFLDFVFTVTLNIEIHRVIYALFLNFSEEVKKSWFFFFFFNRIWASTEVRGSPEEDDCFAEKHNLWETQRGKRERSKSWVAFLHVLVLPKTKKKNRCNQESRVVCGKDYRMEIVRSLPFSLFFFFFLIYFIEIWKIKVRASLWTQIKDLHINPVLPFYAPKYTIIPFCKIVRFTITMGALLLPSRHIIHTTYTEYK